MTNWNAADHAWTPATLYPDPAIRVLDKSFEKYWLRMAAVERLAHGMRWAEGPVWFGDGRYLLWSDIPNNRMLKWEEETGAGLRLPQAVELRQRQHARPPGPARHLRARRPPRHAHRVRRRHHRAHGPLAGQAAQLAQRRRREVRRLDLVHRSAVRHRRATTRATRPRPELAQNVYRVDGESGEATVVADDVLGPNGLCFSPDEKILYVVESRGVPNRKILAYDVAADGRAISNKRVLIDAGPAARRTACAATSTATCGAAGAWATSELDGVLVFAPDGTPIGTHRAAGALRQRLLRRPRSATGCSWRPASRSTRSTSIPRAAPAGSGRPAACARHNSLSHWVSRRRAMPARLAS